MAYLVFVLRHCFVSNIFVCRNRMGPQSLALVILIVPRFHPDEVEALRHFSVIIKCLHSVCFESNNIFIYF